MLDHLSRAIYSLPILATVGLPQKLIRPLAVEELVRVLRAGLVDARLIRQTIAISGQSSSTSAMRHDESPKCLAGILIFPAPLCFHYALALLCERTMKIPLVATAQVRILTDGVVEPATACDPLPPDLMPSRYFSSDQIRGGLFARRPAKVGAGDFSVIRDRAGGTRASGAEAREASDDFAARRKPCPSQSQFLGGRRAWLMIAD